MDSLCQGFFRNRKMIGNYLDGPNPAIAGARSIQIVPKTYTISGNYLAEQLRTFSQVQWRCGAFQNLCEKKDFHTEPEREIIESIEELLGIGFLLLFFCSCIANPFKSLLRSSSQKVGRLFQVTLNNTLKVSLLGKMDTYSLCLSD